jgi:hypothetical protein
MSRRLKIVAACATFLGVYGGVQLLAHEMVRIIPVTPENFMDFNARVAINILSRLYPPATFWVLMWLSRAHREDPTFLEEDAGKVILGFGGALLLFAQGPAFLFPGWLKSDVWFQDDLWVLYNAFYSMGWCFLLAGMFRWPAIRHTLLRSRLGITSLVVSLVWYVAGSLRHEFAWYSIGWSIAAVLSLFIALCGILSPKRSERSFAACGLILMSVYSYYGSKFGGLAWFQIGLLADARVIHPFLLVGLLGWTALVLQATGLFPRLGIEYGEQHERVRDNGGRNHS